MVPVFVVALVVVLVVVVVVGVAVFAEEVVLVGRA